MCPFVSFSSMPGHADSFSGKSTFSVIMKLCV